MAARASEPPEDPDGPAFPDLGLSAVQIYDSASVLARIADDMGGLPSVRGTGTRSRMTEHLRQAIQDGRATITEALEARPFASRDTVIAFRHLTDGVVETAFQVTSTWLHPNPNPTDGERIAVLAVGGYGRGEMAPYSDVDLLFLMPWKVTPWAESLIESMLYMLWDLHLKVGHSARNITDCIRLGQDDHTIRTALLEHRFLIGNSTLADELAVRLKTELFRKTVSEFIESKLQERDSRHRRHGGRRYIIEPNVKEGKGGLRDLQTLFWIGKYIHGVSDAAELVRTGLLSAEEYEKFRAAETFLMAVRCHLHVLSGRAVDQLTIDVQPMLAERLGYKDGTDRPAVERFMLDYFRHATVVGELTRIFLTALEAKHVKKAPALASFFQRRKRVGDQYILRHNRLDIADEHTFLADKLNLLRIFEEALRTGYLIHPDAMRLITANLRLIDDEMRRSPEAIRIFFDTLLEHGNPERALRRMNELGVLAALVPEFEPIVAMMQFNMYHHYTVDEHTIQCISNLAGIERGELVEELPVASGILERGVNRKVLYTALLLHDIGKGRKQDHSILGAHIARKAARRFGLSESEVETVEWLVRYHLLMSDVAQKRDLSDPRTVRDFAKAVQSRERLDLLTVLTVCDIRGVGPGTWNNWKAQLLRDLHAMTADSLERGMEAINRGSMESEAKSALREALADWNEEALQHETSRHYGPYWQGLPHDAHLVIARLLSGIGDNEIRSDLMPDEARDATRICFALADHPGIFARLSGALALAGANVVDARTYTSSDGYATAVFWVQDRDGSPYGTDQMQRLREVIEKTLKGETLPRESLIYKDRRKMKERAFGVPTSISFDNEGSDIYTIIEVDTRDRPGLLYDLAHALAQSNVYIASAVIATYGAQVVDTFYVKDMFGLKYYSKSKQGTLEARLRAAIEAGAERAAAP